MRRLSFLGCGFERGFNGNLVFLDQINCMLMMGFGSNKTYLNLWIDRLTCEYAVWISRCLFGS